MYRCLAGVCSKPFCPSFGKFFVRLLGCEKPSGVDIRFRFIDLSQSLRGKEMVEAFYLVVGAANHHIGNVGVNAGVSSVRGPALGNLEHLIIKLNLWDLRAATSFRI
jgi:hypothetical protein